MITSLGETSSEAYLLMQETSSSSAQAVFKTKRIVSSSFMEIDNRFKLKLLAVNFYGWNFNLKNLMIKQKKLRGFSAVVIGVDNQKLQCNRFANLL